MRRRTLAWGMTVLLSGLIAMSWAQEKTGAPSTVTLKSACCDFAFDPQSGGLLGVDAAKESVTLYPRAYLDGKSAEVIGPVKVGMKPASAIFKRCGTKSYFLVLCRGDRKICVLDAKDLKQVRTVETGGSYANALGAAASPDDPYVYYTGPVGSNKLRRFSLERETDHGDVEILNGHSALEDVAVSADGKYLYSRDSIQYGSGGLQSSAQATDEDPAKRNWREVTYLDDASPQPVPDPFGTYIAVGTVLRTADLKEKAAELSFTPVCFFANKPLIVGIEGGSLVAASHNNFQVYGRVALPAEVAKSEEDTARRRTRRRTDPESVSLAQRFFADGAGDRVVAALGDKVALVALKSLNVPDEPMLAVEVKAPEVLFATCPATIELKPLDKRCAVELKDAPKGMKLTGSTIVWTPDSSQVGTVKVTLRLFHQKFERLQALELEVVQPSVRLSFAADGFAMSPNGKLAVAWTVGPRDRWGMNREKEDEKSRVALIDIEKRKVIAEKKLLYDITSAVVDDHFVYVALSQSDGINLLGLKDLEKANFALTDSRVTALAAIASKWLAAVTEQGVITYAVPEFKPVDTLLTTKGNEMDRQMRRFRRPMRMYDRGDGLPFERFGDGWFAAGCVFGPDFGAARMFVDAEGLPKLTGNRETSAAPPRPWNRQVANGMLLSGADQRIAQLDDRIAIILPDSPVCVALNYGRGDEARWTGDNRQRFTAKLTFLELLSGTTVLTIPLIDSTLTNEAVQLYSANRGVSPLQSHGRQVFALLGDRLFILGIDDETLKKCASPFQFEPPKEVTTVSPKGPTTIKHAMRGGQAPFEFEFKTQRDGLTIDTKTGTVTVDGPKLSKQALELVLQWMQTGLDRDPYDRRPQPDAKQAVADFTKKQKARFKQLAGREPAGIPVLVPVSVTASDKNQQVASLDYEVVLEVPDDAIQQFISLKAEEQKQRMAEAEKQRAEAERRMREQEKKWADEQRKRDAETPAAGGADERVRKLEERIAELDEKIKSLEAKIDLLVKLIQSQKTPDERK